MADFYLRNRHLFLDDDDPLFVSKMENLSGMVPKLSNNLSYPKFMSRERIMPPEPQKNIFSQNANLLLGNVHNNRFLTMEDKYTSPYQVNSINAFKEPPLTRNYSHVDNSRKAATIPTKPNNSSGMSAILNPTALSSLPKDRSWTEKPERKNFFNYGQREDVYSLAGAVKKNLDSFAPPAGYRKPDIVPPQSRNMIDIPRSINELRLPSKNNLNAPPSWVDNDISDRYRRDTSAPPLRNKNQRDMMDIKLAESSVKVTDVDPVNGTKKAFTFPHNDYQALKRKLGVKSDVGQAGPFPNTKSHLPYNRETRLGQLEMVRGRRNVPEALERRLLTAMDPVYLS